jgi:hypothetical protein
MNPVVKLMPPVITEDSLREDGEYVIIEPAAGFWLDVKQQHTGLLIVKMQKDS